MNILYIFPHPDDESFGAASAIHRQIEDGHAVHLLTLTKGGATQQRHKLGLSVGEMGEVRYNEMLNVEKVLGLSSMTVLDFPDSGLKELDPRVLEVAVNMHIKQIKPAVVITYPVHGISGFHDHLVAHAVVKRVYMELRDQREEYLKRLAFMTLEDSGAPSWTPEGPRLKHTEKGLIDCIVPLQLSDIQAMKDALACYATYKDTIEKSGIIEKVGEALAFEIFGEDFNPPLVNICDNLPVD